MLSPDVGLNPKFAEAMRQGLVSPVRALDPVHAAGHTPRPGANLTPRDKGYQTPMYRTGGGRKGRKVVSPVAFRKLDFGPDGAL